VNDYKFLPASTIIQFGNLKCLLCNENEINIEEIFAAYVAYDNDGNTYRAKHYFSNGSWELIVIGGESKLFEVAEVQIFGS
jgi:hypothetical protein